MFFKKFYANSFLKQVVLLSITVMAFAGAVAQSDDITPGGKEYTLLNRLDILLKNDSVFNYTTVKPYNRQVFTRRMEYIDSLAKAGSLSIKLSPVDRNNIRRFLMDNAEWTRDIQDSFKVKKPILGGLYKTPGHLLEVNDNTAFYLYQLRQCYQQHPLQPAAGPPPGCQCKGSGFACQLSAPAQVVFYSKNYCV